MTMPIYCRTQDCRYRYHAHGPHSFEAPEVSAAAVLVLDEAITQLARLGLTKGKANGPDGSRCLIAHLSAAAYTHGVDHYGALARVRRVLWRDIKTKLAPVDWSDHPATTTADVAYVLQRAKGVSFGHDQSVRAGANAGTAH